MSNSRAGGGGIPKGISLANTVHSEVAPCLPLPSLPVFCGALDQELRLVDEPNGSARQLKRSDVADQASKISKLLQATDVSYLNLRTDGTQLPHGHEEHLDLYDEVLRCNSEAFEHNAPGPAKEQRYNNTVPNNNKVSERKLFVQNLSTNNEVLKDKGEIPRPHEHDINTSASRKPKAKKKTSDDTFLSTEPDVTERQDAAVERFCEVLEDLCGKAEISVDDREEGDSEWLLLPVGNIRNLVKEVMSIRANKILHLVPAVLLEKMLKILDHQIHSAEGLSINQSENSNSDVVSAIMVALESMHSAVGIMAYNGMPKQIYKEEIIERIVEFSRRQIADVMSACDSSYRSTIKPIDNDNWQDEEDDDDYDEEFGSASKRRRTAKSVKVRKSGANKASAAAHNILQKLCTILVFLKDLLMIERLSDSCILQLVKTCFSTLLVDNIQLLQLKAIGLIGGIFYSYPQHRVYVMDELLHLLMKLPFSKRIPRTYHLADEEQKQIQMITALLIQLIHCSGNLPASLREASGNNPLFNIGIDSSYPHKSQEAVNEACFLFWSRVLQRFANTKNQNQDASEFKIMLENLVMDLLATLNLPEYPASAHILEVLCVILLQNAGLKSKDIAARSIAIDILGTVAARLKREAVLCKKEKYWIVQELLKGEENDENSYPEDACSVCLDSRIEKPLILCEGCQRLFHSDCLGMRENDVSGNSWQCQLCLCRKQLLSLQSYCKTQQGAGEVNHTRKKSKSTDTTDITKTEIVQQLLLNYLQDSGSAEDVHIFTRWFYMCLWYKDDPSSQEKFLYYLSRIKSKAIVRGSGMVSLTRSFAKKITLALGQNSSFTRGFDKILHLLLASLREGSPVIRAKALRAVSIIVEADPEVLGDKYVQAAVEGRFCDSAISVREAALELVGRYIASHPNVALRYYGKVAERVKDTGVSVRKRAIRIIKDMCASNANFPEFDSACIEILSRISDEESSIQDLVCKTFYEFWFEESSGSQNQIFEEGSSVTLEIAKKTEQMVQMLRIMPSNQFLVIVIKRNLALDFLPQAAKAAGISPVMLASVRKRCELMCKCLLEKILRVEENTNEVDVGALHYILLLHAFCLVDPALCAPASNPSQFLVTLQPYLKKQADSRAVAQLVESIVFVIDSVLPLIRKLPPSVVEDLEQDLKQMIVRHSYLTVVHACIKCLCSISKVAGNGGSVVGYLIQAFFKRLDSLGFNNTQQVCRSLFCLGLLIRYGSSFLGMSLSTKQNQAVSGTLSLFKKYFHADDFALKIRSLQALGYVLIARPQFMLEKDIEDILEATLSSNTDARLKMQSLQNLYEYLLDSERQMEDKAEKDSNAHNTDAGPGSVVPVAAGAGDTNICGGIIQLYWNSILGRCLDADEDVRQSALKIVEIVLRQGLVHPITCVPYLIALETDPQEANSKLAHHLLMNMNEKYPAFFESRLGDGLQMSFIFMQSMSGSFSNPEIQTKTPNNAKGKSDGSSFSYARLGVSRIYKVIRGNRASRNKFMTSIVRKFDTPGWHNSVVPFLIYCTEILSLLPFGLPEEPLYLIYAINRVIQVRAGAIEANMKTFLHTLQGQNRKESTNGVVQHEPFAPPVLNESAYADSNMPKQEFPTEISFTRDVTVELGQNSMNLDNPIVISEHDLPKIQADCLAACALQLLLKLKRHLKIIYGLDDARCQAFSPTEPPKPGEFLSRQNIPFNVAETNITRPTTYPDILQRYQEFKNALKEDTVDYSVYTANIKRKKPPGRKSSKVIGATRTNGGTHNGDRF